ncbi:ring canal kelch homolog [Metopolophium dirhodum]|uniref:ring canal kelch homolog n=1 Tax=Metopolophium dirhodum TaxID=44670 RepID=UPI00298F96A2|nr:ring canal kelch homolog [Metopolophium dirhodum]
MNTLPASSSKSDPIQVQSTKECETIEYIRNNSDSDRILEDLQSLRINEVLCDIRLETNDGAIVVGHKNVLMAASPYFREMFANFDERNKDVVKISEFNSDVLRLLVDYMYSGQIIITKENLKVLLHAANILQSDFLNIACAEFLKKQLDASNCFRIKAFAHSHNCPIILSSSETYIKKHYLDVAKSEDFLSLSSEDVVKIISCNDIAVPFEEKVFESIIKWIRHDLEHRKDFLPELMEHIRLPLLASMPDILNNIVEEPLLKNNPKCNNYIIEALHFNPHESVEHFTTPQKIRCKSRLFGGSQKVILIFSRSKTLPRCYMEWYDPVTKVREDAPEMNDCLLLPGFGVIRDKYVYSVGSMDIMSSASVSMLDVSSRSPSWAPMVNMSAIRSGLGVGVMDNCIYAVGGENGTNNLNSVEVFDVSIQKWRMVSSMSTTRRNMGVGVLNNCLYAAGGINSEILNSVECYDPTLDTWTTVSNMSVRRANFGVGVLDSAIYAIGGYNESEFLKSAEKYLPSDGVWSTIADMHVRRDGPGVVALDGLLYVFGGDIDNSIVDTVEIYNPNTNTWSIQPFPYFRAMFNNFDESNKDLVKIRELDSALLRLLIDYIYTGKIKVSEENVQGLLPAGNIFQLDFVKDSCSDYLQKQLDATNCLGIKEFANLHNCRELLSSSEKYIKRHYLKVVKSEDFLSMSVDDLAKLIACNDLFAFEGNIYESVIKWIRHDLERRKDFLPRLMEHICLPSLPSLPDILNSLVEEPLPNTSPECDDDYVFDDFSSEPRKTVENFNLPRTMKSQPRQFDGPQKVILIFARSKTSPKCSTEWYDPITQVRKDGPEMNDCRMTAGIGVISDQFVFVTGGVNKSSSKSVSMLDASSQSSTWAPIVDMLVSRNRLGVGVLDNCIYAVGGHDGTSALNSVEVFDISIQQWEMVSSMSTARTNTCVGVFNNRLYAVGGHDGVSYLKSVECYDPSIDNWTPVSDMSAPRDGVGVGVIDGVIYVVGGYDGTEFLKRAEIYRPSDGVWSTIKNMHMARNRPGVVAFGGLLYVFGGEIEKSIVDIVEVYSPDTNTWSLEIFSRDCSGIFFNAIAVDKPSDFITN